MAAVPITIVGTITTKAPKEGGEVSGSGIEQCVINGIASLSGLEVGGGPILPGEKPPAQPPGIWGPPGPWPTPPIANVPGLPPTQNPPGWGLRPEHPIVLPPDGPPVIPPSEPPSANWDWGWSPAYGWHPVYTPGDKPQPPPVGP